jgi:opacity protein-like surface antigen
MQKRIVVWMVLVFCLVVTQNASAKTDLGWRSVGVNAGFVDPDNVDGTIGFGAFANLGNLSPDVRLQPNLGYWSKSEEFGGDKATISDIALSARALYMFHGTSPKFRPYAGGGLGLHMVHAKVEVAAQDLGGGVIIPAMEASDTSTKLGLDLVGGFTTPLSQKNDLCVDLGYTAVSDVAQFSMKVGVSFDLGGSPRAESVRPSPKPSTHKTTKARH